MNRKSMKKIALAVSAAWILGMAASGAVAGEITGNGKSLKNPNGTLNGRSICAFSGLNDTYSGDPNVPDEDGFFRTQSWGQVPKALKIVLTSLGLHPGEACNPTTGD